MTEVRSKTMLRQDANRRFCSTGILGMWPGLPRDLPEPYSEKRMYRNELAFSLTLRCYGLHPVNDNAICMFKSRAGRILAGNSEPCGVYFLSL
jgi:hypothetical protein